MGHEYFGDCVAAVGAAMRNPVHEELSITAAWALQGVARRLAEASPAVRAPFLVELQGLSFRVLYPTPSHMKGVWAGPFATHRCRSLFALAVLSSPMQLGTCPL